MNEEKFIAKVRLIRAKIEELALDLDDTTAYDFPALFMAWKAPETYSVGDRVQYKEQLYKCLQSHVSQSDWTPDTAVSLWTAVPDPHVEWPEWVQPTGVHDAYQTGDKVSHNEKHWVSNSDNNVWEPGIFGWDEA